MTRTCPYCDDVLPAERFEDHLELCAPNKPAPPPPGRFLLTCSRPDCLLHKGTSFPGLAEAELVAWAHEQRNSKEYRGQGDHRVVLEDLNDVPASQKPAAGKPDGGGA